MLAAVALVATCAAPGRAADNGSFLEDAGWGTLTVLGNVLYMPAKVTYSLLGAVTGGLAYALTGADMEVAENIWVPAMGGTYVLTPRMLQGEDPIAFAGTRQPSPPVDARADEPPPPRLREERLTVR